MAARQEIVDLLRQRARPYLFSNTLAPAIVSGTLQALELLEQSGELRVTLRRNAALFRTLMEAEGFDLLPGEHPIVPVMFGDAALTARIADALQAKGVYVTAFSFPVVPRGAARIRVQLSAAHSDDEIRRCVAAFAAARDEVAAAAPVVTRPLAPARSPPPAGRPLADSPARPSEVPTLAGTSPPATVTICGIRSDTPARTSTARRARSYIRRDVRRGASNPRAAAELGAARIDSA